MIQNLKVAWGAESATREELTVVEAEGKYQVRPNQVQ